MYNSIPFSDGTFNRLTVKMSVQDVQLESAAFEPGWLEASLEAGPL